MVQGLLRWRRHAAPHGEATPRHGDAGPPALLIEYGTRDARDRFSLLLRRVRGGEQILITHAGHPVAKLVAYDGDGSEPRRPGVIRVEAVVPGVRRPASRRQPAS